MTKISTYTLDEKITALDKWIGSDVNMQNRTKNFTPKKLAEYFNENQVINIGVPLQYKYYTLDPLEERPNGTLTFETEIGPTVNFSAVTTFLLSKYTTKQNIVSDFLNFLDGCKVLLFKSSDINSFGFYRISNIEPYEPDPNFFVVTVDYETGNGFMQEDNDYMLSLVSLPGGAIPTKTSELINDGDNGINPFISEVDINRAEWDAAYDGKINSAEVTGTSTKTLTLTKQDGSTIEASWTDDNTDAVTSVFGRTGDVTAQSGDYNTGQITEVTNKKYQTDNQALFNDATSSIQTQLNSKQPSLGYTPVPNTRTITINGTSYDLSANRSWTIDTNSAVWGNISGMLSNQTDLQIALNAKVPYSGATENINLGEYGLTSGYYKFDLTPTGTPTSLGTMYWDSFYRTVSLIDGDGDTTLQIGQEERVLVHNNTGSTLTDGQVVYVTGSTGELPSVSLASNISEATSSVTFGVVTEAILNGADGFITTSGIIHGLNTLSYDEGSAIWLGSTPGTFTQTKPVAPLNSVLVGYVIKKSGGNGSIFVKIQNGYELEELHDVLISNVSGNEILAYEGSPTNLWKNKSVIDVLGFTPYNSTNPSNYISLTALSSTATGLSYNNTNGVFSLTSGYVIPTTTEESNWNTAYSNRITSASSPLSISSNSISISQATSTTNGYLTSSDWTTFNNKQAAGNYITALTGEATASGPGSASVTLVNSAVTGKVLTGVNITGGSIADTDSILTAFGKVQNQINGLIGGSIYQSVWNASTNTPTLTSSVGTKGYYYIVNVAGSTNLNGITDWKVGDWAIYDGTSWQKVDNTDAVSSVNGFTGAVSLTTSNISEGTNLYYTEGRVSANTDVAANTAARHNAVTLGTANGLSLSTQVLSLGLASTSTNGALSSTDWNTFNNKANNNAVVHLTGNETIDGIKTFIGSSIILDNSSGTTISTFKGASTTVAEFVFNSSFTQFRSVASGGYLFKNSASANSLSITDSGNATFLGSITAASFIKSGGTSSQFLKADGSVDSTSYQPLLTNPITGSLTTNYIPKATGASSLGNSLIYDNGTNVGIGTTSPAYQLTLNKNDNNYLQIRSSDTGAAGIYFGRQNDSVRGGIYYDNNTDALYFKTSNLTTNTVITSGGNVLIGTTTDAGYKLDVNGTGRFTTSTNKNIIIKDASHSTLGNLTSAITFSRPDGVSDLASIFGGGESGGLAIAARGGLSFLTGGGALYTTTVQRMTILENGNVGIGTTSPSALLDVNGKAVFGSGTAASPSISFRNSTDTGFYQTDDGTGALVHLGIGGNNKVTFKHNGNVGIGTTSPSFKLEVNAIGVGIVHTDGTRLFATYLDSTGVAVGSRSNHNFHLYTNNGSPQVTLTTGGNVGIGTKSPTGRLTIQRASSGAETDIDFLNEVGAGPKAKIRFGGTNEELSFWTGGTSLLERMRIFSSGNVFIGSSPVDAGYKLDVNGTARASVFSVNANGTIQSSGFWGTLTTAGAGSYADWAVINSATTAIMHNPTGTLNMKFGGSVFVGDEIFINGSGNTNVFFQQNSTNKWIAGYVPSISAFRFSNNSSDVLTLSNGGKVGINISPSSMLEIKDPSSTNSIQLGHIAAGGGYNMVSLNGTNAEGQYIGIAGGGGTDTNFYYQSGNAGSHNFRTGDGTNYVDRMRIFSSGNVFIGSSPVDAGYKLDVNGGSAFRDTLRMVASGVDAAYLSWTGSNTGVLSLLHSGSVTTQILASGNSYFNGGNVGIATISPSQKLEVNGVIESPYLEYKPVVFYDFNSDTTGDWSKSGATLSVPSKSVTRFTSTAFDPNISRAFNFSGGQNQIIRIRYKVISGDSGSGEIFYENSQHSFSGSYYKSFTLVNDNQWHTLVLDMSQLNSGGTDWIDYNVTQIRFDLTNNAGVVIDIDWISIGGNGYGTQYFENNVAFMNGNVGVGNQYPLVGLEINVGTESLPATSGTTPNGAVLRVKPSTTNGCMDFGNAGGGRSWIQSTNAGALSEVYSLLLNPNGGNVLIGTPTDAGYKLDVNGRGNFTGGINIPSGVDISFGVSSGNYIGQYYSSSDSKLKFYNGTGGSNIIEIYRPTGAVLFSNTVTATGFFNSSDNRLKEVVEYDYNVSDIKPITYLWKDGRDSQKHVGYSAQQVRELMPDAVNEDADGMLSVNYIEVLVAKIAELENRIKQLEK